jgi:hypothetical protein
MIATIGFWATVVPLFALACGFTLYCWKGAAALEAWGTFVSTVLRGDKSKTVAEPDRLQPTRQPGRRQQ